MQRITIPMPEASVGPLGGALTRITSTLKVLSMLAARCAASLTPTELSSPTTNAARRLDSFTTPDRQNRTGGEVDDLRDDAHHKAPDWPQTPAAITIRPAPRSSWVSAALPLFR